MKKTLKFTIIFLISAISQIAASKSTMPAATGGTASIEVEPDIFLASKESSDYGSFQRLVKPETIELTRQILQPLARFDLSGKKWLFVFAKIVEILNEKPVPSVPFIFETTVNEEVRIRKPVKVTKMFTRIISGKKKTIPMEVEEMRESIEIIPVRKRNEININENVLTLMKILENLLPESIDETTEAKFIYSLLDHLPEISPAEPAPGAGGPRPAKSPYGSPEEITENIKRYEYALSLLSRDQKQYSFNFFNMCRGMTESQINELWRLRENWWDPEDPVTPMEALSSFNKVATRLLKARINIRGLRDPHRDHWTAVRAAYGIRD